MAKLSVILMLAASAVCAAPVVSCRMGLDESGTFRIARDWLLVCGPGEETNDGIPKWTVEVVRESDKVVWCQTPCIPRPKFQRFS